MLLYNHLIELTIMELTNKQTLELTNTKQSGETNIYKQMATKLRYNLF